MSNLVMLNTVLSWTQQFIGSSVITTLLLTYSSVIRERGEKSVSAYNNCCWLYDENSWPVRCMLCIRCIPISKMNRFIHCSVVACWEKGKRINIEVSEVELSTMVKNSPCNVHNAFSRFSPPSLSDSSTRKVRRRKTNRLFPCYLNCKRLLELLV